MQAGATNKLLVKFFFAAVIFLGWGVIQGALQAQKPIHDFLTQGPADIIIGAHTHINLLGWVSLSLAGLIYYLIPILTNKSIAAPRLINWIFWVWAIDLPIMAILMISAGIAGGNAFANGTTGAQLDAVLAPYMIPIGILSILCGITVLTFVIQILVSIGRKSVYKNI
jgi:cbb3-type cytochrome oxidase subunit 1